MLFGRHRKQQNHKGEEEIPGLNSQNRRIVPSLPWNKLWKTSRNDFLSLLSCFNSSNPEVYTYVGDISTCQTCSGLGFLNYEFRTLTSAPNVEVSCRSPTLSKAVCGTPLGWVIGPNLTGSYNNKRFGASPTDESRQRLQDETHQPTFFSHSHLPQIPFTPSIILPFKETDEAIHPAEEMTRGGKPGIRFAGSELGCQVGGRKVDPGVRKPGHSQVTEPPFQRAASATNKTNGPRSDRSQIN
ncbi:hypothetical protein WN51_14667 [Melipona quadrifasciata]|uniref:Uncharacterized protein n=1 Tax=Melipona quadrifasciata TaxID=166423 RepID=A0A0M9A087_9HYME|nr:hypothetical protein WN51_14667 [Melipona quadrifasciata]